MHVASESDAVNLDASLAQAILEEQSGRIGALEAELIALQADNAQLMVRLSPVHRVEGSPRL
jgi:hypothetical protein